MPFFPLPPPNDFPVERPSGPGPLLAPDPFGALVTSITAQQVSVRAALAARGRLVRRLGGPGGRAWALPSRKRLARASARPLVALGLARRKEARALGRRLSFLASLAVPFLLPGLRVSS